MAAQKALIGTATSTLGPKTRNPALARHFHEEYVEHNVESLALAVIGQKLSDEACLSLFLRTGNLRGWL